MSKDLLSSALIMVSDVDNLDKDGLEAFNHAFKSSLEPPTTISTKIESGAMSLAGSACGYIFWTIFFVATAIVIALACVEVISWPVSTILIIIIGAGILLMASLLYNRVNDFVSRAKSELNSHMSDYTEGMMENVINAFKNGVVAYASHKKIEVYEDPSEDYEMEI